MSQKNEILKNLTELIGKELFVSPDELSPSEKQIIDISAGIISSLDNDLADLQKKYRELEIKNINQQIMIKDILEDRNNSQLNPNSEI